MHIVTYLVPFLGLIGLVFMLFKARWVLRQANGEEKMRIISGHISKGALAFLQAEWRVLAYFVGIAAILLAYSGTLLEGSHPMIGGAFLLGALFSAFAGWVGMHIATRANVRTTQAARSSLSQAFRVSFQGGAVMGLGVAGLVVIGMGALFIVLYQFFVPAESTLTAHEMRQVIEVLTGFSLGAESIALFARVGGGIYTKAADVGADLVGKVEAGIPEDDPRNPATIADNVGDNVGDVAGMGADLFGSYVATILASMVLGQEIDARADAFGGASPILLPMLVAGFGLLFSALSTYAVRLKKTAQTEQEVQKALNLGNWLSIVLTAVMSYFLVTYLLPPSLSIRGVSFESIHIFYAILLGLFGGRADEYHHRVLYLYG